jgi:hypothetical protein
VGVNKSQAVPVNVVGSSKFGLYPKISDERTYNMFISDDFLVNYSGFQKVSEVKTGAKGRGLFHSIRGNFALGVIGSGVYKFNENMSPQFIKNIDTSSGEVSIDENLNRQICIVDGQNAYIYNYDNASFTKQSLSFSPGYVAYHNSFFLLSSTFSDTNPQSWYAARYDSATTITIASADTFTLQTKPDSALAIKRLPGKGNNVIVFGSSVAEVWSNVGGAENYRRISSFNIDGGAVSINTIAASEDVVCWLGKNENNSPSLMVTDGSQTKRISTDGIDGLMQNISRPDQSTAFFYRQDGHLFYQITFFNDADNLSLIYDFNTSQFFHVTDEDLNFHPARQVIYFNEKSFFISLNDGFVYQMGSQFVTYNYNLNANDSGDIIPRIRICNTVRMENSDRFRIGKFTFWLEQGVNDFYVLNANDVSCVGLIVTEDVGDQIVTESGIAMIDESGYCIENANRPRVDMSFSKNGNQSFSNIVSNYMNPEGKYRNQINWHRMGSANEFTIQLRFWGMQRIVAKNGLVEVY